MKKLYDKIKKAYKTWKLKREFKKKIKELTDERKSKYGGEYARKLNAETDPKKKEEMLKPIQAITSQIVSQQKNLLSMLDMEERYYSNMGKDDELDPNFA